MRPTTPKFNFVAQASPSSPPETPTTPQFQYRQYKTRRNGMVFAPSVIANVPTDPISIPREQLPRTASPFYTNHTELSPRSSSPASSLDSSVLSTSNPALESLSSSANDHISTSPPRPTRTRIISLLKANFTVEEFRDSEYEDWDSEDGSIIRPSQYEDAESERGSVRNASHAASTSNTYTHVPTTQVRHSSPAIQSHKYTPPRRVTPQKPIDPKVMQHLTGLNFGNSDTEGEDSDDDGGYAEHQAWVERQRAEKRRKRRSSSSFKRSFTQSLGSSSDDEDLMPLGPLDANDAGSSARRLRRRTQEGRTSLIFDDPPPRIDELEEPESCEEVVEMGEDEVRKGLAKEFPYWIQEDMELDQTSSEEDSDSDDD